MVEQIPEMPVEEPKKMKGLTEGRIVHFVMNNGEHRPSIIVKVWNAVTGTVNMQVFTDGTNDVEPPSTPNESTLLQEAIATGILWRTSITYNEEKTPNTWHWIEQA